MGFSHGFEKVAVVGAAAGLIGRAAVKGVGKATSVALRGSNRILGGTLGTMATLGQGLSDGKKNINLMNSAIQR